MKMENERLCIEISEHGAEVTRKIGRASCRERV